VDVKRKAASASERARQSIAKTIKSVLERIVQSDAQLGDFFALCIKTGNFCCYRPDPDFPIAWEFAATDLDTTIEPTEQPTSSGDTTPARADHPPASPVVLEASPFSLAERTNPFLWDGNLRQRNSRDHRSRTDRPRIAGHARGWTRRRQEPFGDGNGAVRVAGWLSMPGGALLRKRRTISLSPFR
jgi:hypothetical protein